MTTMWKFLVWDQQSWYMNEFLILPRPLHLDKRVTLPPGGHKAQDTRHSCSPVTRSCWWLVSLHSYVPCWCWWLCKDSALTKAQAVACLRGQQPAQASPLLRGGEIHSAVVTHCQTYPDTVAVFLKWLILHRYITPNMTPVHCDNDIETHLKYASMIFWHLMLNAIVISLLCGMWYGE